MYERIRGEKSLLSINQHHGVQFRYMYIVQISDNNILGLFFTTRSVHVHLLCSLQKKKNKPYTIIAYLYVHTTSQ